jgi:hypothetical protein
VSAIPSGVLDWYETGGIRPIHERGRAWDGGGDTRANGDQSYAVGVEWEFQDFGFGIVQITAFTSATQVTALVTKNLPAGVVGGVGAPANTWNHTGDGSDTTFAIAGATSTSYQDYIVTIDGEPVPSGQYPPPSGGIGGGGGDGDFNNSLRPIQQY